jgi:hypothetical protein
MTIADILAPPQPLDDSSAAPPLPARELDEKDDDDRWTDMPCTD